MQQNIKSALRRIIEALIITLIPSGTVFMLIMAGVIPSTKGGYIGAFGALALIFLTLNYKSLYTHFWASGFSILKYSALNLSIWAVCMTSGFISLRYFSSNIYTAFFGYTKPFRQIFDMSALESACLFWALYLFLIVFVLIKVLFFDWAYKQRLKERQTQKLEMETINFMEDKTK